MGVFVYRSGAMAVLAQVRRPVRGRVAVSAGSAFINSGGYAARTTDSGSNWLNVSNN